MEETIRIYFHNIQSFVNKRTTFLNHRLSTQFDIYLFQESNIKEKHGAFYDDWNLAGLLAQNLSLCDSDSWRRGTIIGHIPEIIVQNTTPDFITESDFEIRTVRVFTKNDSFNLISAYRSPSMSKNEQMKFFELLVDVIDEISGGIVLLGDLNITPRRVFRSNKTEDIFIQMIENTGLTSVLDEPTRKGVQLDYCFTSMNIKCKLASASGYDVLSKNDHDAVCLEMEFGLETHMIPRTVVLKTEAITESCFNLVMENSIMQIFQEQEKRMKEPCSDQDNPNRRCRPNINSFRGDNSEINPLREDSSNVDPFREDNCNGDCNAICP